MQIGEALRLLRTGKGLSQIDASKREGAPDFRTLSHWENNRKLPSFKLLCSYLTILGLDFGDLQAALDQVEGRMPKRLQDELERLDRRVGDLEQRLGCEPRSPSGADPVREDHAPAPHHEEGAMR